LYVLFFLWKDKICERPKSQLYAVPRRKSRLMSLAKSKTASCRKVRRAGIILKYMEGESIAAIAAHFRTNRPLVERCLDKAITFGVDRGLKDLSGRGVKAKITGEARSYILSIACQSPSSLGYAQETWTYSLLKAHIRRHCKEAGYEMLSKIGKCVLQVIWKRENKPSQYQLLFGKT